MFGEWVIVSREPEDLNFIYVWVSTFVRGKLNKKMPIYLSVDSKNEAIKILDIKVLGNDRSKGYGSALIEELFEIIKERKIKAIKGLAERPNDPILINFYKKYGIEIVGSQLKWN